MSSSIEDVAKALRASVKEAELLKQQNRDLRTSLEEPIAIVGMSCRYPGGASSPGELWELVSTGRDAIGEFPANRGWDAKRLYDPDPDTPGTIYSRHGGFLYDAGEFDAAFFGISPREALAMDPQQRLLLEGVWEAFEDAGLDPASLRGSQTGVFAGVTASEYRNHDESEELEGYRLTGGTASVASGRISYAFGFEGPAVSIDTACSSSLVAMHLACEALRKEECGLALAGGVTVMTTPGLFVEFARQRGLSPDGRCKSFAEAADGTGFSEGMGLLLLERLSEAEAHGHEVLALIRGSAVNQDGASNGLTAPNGPSQQRVIAQALANARVSAAKVDAVEAHGTGTVLGDPIEAQALLATYGKERANGPLRLGSIKSNIGHSVAAAGVAGVIKMVQALREDVLPRTLHIDEPSTSVDWSAGEIELLSEQVPWERSGEPRLAGVSSFGISGTNAHLILEEAPAPDPSVVDRNGGDPEGTPTPPLTETTLPWLLSAKTYPALREVAGRLAAHLKANPELEMEDVGFSLATSRTELDRRAVLLGAERDELLTALDVLQGAEAGPAPIQGKARKGTLAYLLTGQGSQRPGMGQGLYEASPRFASALDELVAPLDQHLEGPLKEIVFDTHPQAKELLADTAYAQPALFALEVALFRLLEDFGLSPDLLAGHSIGEIAAAHLSGVLSLSDAAKFVCARGRLMGELPAGGAMIAIEASEQEACEALQGKEAEVSLAAVNGPTSVVISGVEQTVAEIAEGFSAQGKKTKLLNVSHAFHSPLMDPMLARFAEVAQGLDYQEPKIPIVSNLSGEILSAEQATDPAYWVRHAREPVRFADAVSTLHSQGATAYLELGPDGVLSALAQQSLPPAEEGEAPAPTMPALRGERPDPEALMTALAELWAAGTKVDWAAAHRGSGAKRTSLPTYPFQRERYWLSPPMGGGGNAPSLGLAKAEHPLLGANVALAEGAGALFTGRISLESHPWLADHGVLGVVLVPGVTFVELALYAGAELGAEHLEELVIEAPLVMEEQGAVQIQLTLGEPDEEGRRAISIHSRPEATDDEEREWTRHAAGHLAQAKEESPALRERAASLAGTWPPEGAEPLGVEDFYDHMASVGLEYGRAFLGVRALWKRDGEIFAELSLAEGERSEAAAFGIHPALLDAAVQAFAASTMGVEVEEDMLGLPFAFNGVGLHATGATELRIRVSLDDADVSLVATDESGSLAASLQSMTVRGVSREQLAAARGANRDSLFALRWSPVRQPPLGQEPPSHVLLDFTENAKPEEAQQIASRALAQIQAYLADEDLTASRLVVLTREAVRAKDGDKLTGLASSPLWGLVRSAQSENPGRIALIDTDASEASTEALAGALASDEPQLAIRQGEVLVPRLYRVQPPEEKEPPRPFDPNRTTLITGATGTLGSLVARHLVEAHGARHLLLASRQGPEAEGATELKEELEALGATAEIAACDISDRSQLEVLLEGIDPEHRLGAVIHAAGALDDATIASLDPERLKRVFAPKLDAAWHLHELTEQMELSEFVLFSSAAATLGSPGQGNYAAANAFLDSLAAYRQANGLPATSVAWGPWDSGMAAGLDDAARKRLARLGMAPLDDEQGLDLFDSALATGEGFALAAPLDRASLRTAAKAGMLPPILGELVPVPTHRSSERAGLLAKRLAEVPEAEREGVVLELVLAEIAAVLGHASAKEIDKQRAFAELGFDSLSAVELRNRLNALSGVQLPATLVFDYPTPTEVATYLLGELAGIKAPAAPAAVSVRPVEEPIAIVGMSCRYPGGASSPGELWELVASGSDAISEFPADRGWDVERLYDSDPDAQGTSYSRHGGFVDDVADFDAHFFGISPREALAMDPQQRLLLEGTWEAFEDAGIDPASLRGSRTGVFTGVSSSDYGTQGGSEGLEGYWLTGATSSVASGRLAYSFGLEGPAVSIDTACSSSLVAMHLACQALRQGECEMALAGGVMVLALPRLFLEFARQRGLSADGRCKSFAEAADGAGFSEGMGLVLLEPLSAARATGHEVLALVRGSAVNQDGASNGLTAPNGPSQQRVIAQALANARVSAARVDAVEAHGTGTVLGDPIEAQALLATYGKERSNGPLRLGSIKSNIGHTGTAAGAAGVIKMVQALREGALPKTLHVDEPSSHVDWSAGEIELLSEQVPWQPDGEPRLAGVSSFGISGTNAHLILEEAPPLDPIAEGDDADGGHPEQAPTSLLTGTPLPWLLSAKTEPALREAAGRLAAHLRANPQMETEDVGFSLATSRAELDRRAILVGGEREELASALDSLQRGEGVAGLALGKAKAGPLAYLLTGQGSQRPGMGKGLYEASPPFASALDELFAHLDQHLEQPLKEIVFASHPEAKRLLTDTAYAQPALFALEVALFRLLEAFGLRPALLAGHSIGEIAAAHLSGVLSLPDAAKLVCARGRLMSELPGGGAMIAIEASEEETREAVEGHEAEVSLAAINGPTSVVITGVEEAVSEIAESFSAQGRKTKRLDVSHAFHSPLMESMLAAFAEVAE
ncbi:MAG TPA: type I polyketide synthase, partial [Solirubrobacterales bacterium]|nr:type I polyketide synthase [Solirubrobacterales bacterium]